MDTEQYPSRKDRPGCNASPSASQSTSIQDDDRRHRKASLKKTDLPRRFSDPKVRKSSGADSYKREPSSLKTGPNVEENDESSPGWQIPNHSEALASKDSHKFVVRDETEVKESFFNSRDVSETSALVASTPGMYQSTTDDEGNQPSVATSFVPTVKLAASSDIPVLPSLSPSSSDTLSKPAFLRRRSKQRASSPLAMAHIDVTSPIGSEDQYDDVETARWGWLLLACTWIVFVIGMGSCLGVWSWAWDVGETPYAPPELEDDDTLPIVGYYPALMILTGAVMSWVWVVVAWVGMKYFRHAKVAGEDSH